MKNLLTDIKNIIKIDEDVERITLKSIINNGSNGPYLVLFIVALLIAIPIPILSTIFGLINAIISYQVLTNKKNIKLPKRLSNLSVSKNSLSLVIEKISFYINKIELLTKNRLLFLTNKKFVNIFIFLFSLLSMSPVPFLSILAVAAILLIIFGFTNKDGLFILLGIIIGIVNIFLQILFLILGKALFVKIFYVIEVLTDWG